MALDTYAALQTSVAGWLNRADLTAAVPDFIALAEPQITRRLIANGPVRQMLTRADAVITGEYSILPTDFMGIRSMYVSGMTSGSKIEFCEPDKIADAKIREPNACGDPRLWTIFGNTIQFWPWAADSDGFSIEIGYWQSIPPLSNTNTTNWLLATYPDAYLYGALVQSAPYLKDDNRLTVWGTLFTTILDDIVAADKIARFAPNLAPPALTYCP